MNEFTLSIETMQDMTIGEINRREEEVRKLNSGAGE